MMTGAEESVAPEATKEPQPTSREGDFSFASFFVSNERFGIDLVRIKEIVNDAPLKSSSKIPGFIKGMLEIRGMALPVVDLNERFFPGRPYQGPTRIMIVLIDGLVLGLAVGEVTDIDTQVELPVSDDDKGQQQREELSAPLERCFERRVRGEEGSALLIDLDRLFTPSEKKLLLKPSP